MINIGIGIKAPDFTLIDTNMKPVSLHDFYGQKVVLAFFIGEFTAICSMETCAFRDSMDRLIDLDAQVIGISVNDPAENKSYAEENILPYPILSDYNHEVSKRYGLEASLASEGSIVEKRSIIIIDQEGIIQYLWVASRPDEEPNYQEIQDKVAKITKRQN